MNVFRHNAERRVGKFQNLLIISQQGLYTTVCCNSGVFWKKSHPLHAPPSPWNNAHCKSFYSKQANRQAPLCCVSHHFIASSICFLDLLESNTMKSSGEPPSPTLSLFRFLSPLFFFHVASCRDVLQLTAVIGCSLSQLPFKQKHSLSADRVQQQKVELRCGKFLFWHVISSLNVHPSSAREKRGMPTGSRATCWYLKTVRGEWKELFLNTEWDMGSEYRPLSPAESRRSLFIGMCLTFDDMLQFSVYVFKQKW